VELSAQILGRCAHIGDFYGKGKPKAWFVSLDPAIQSAKFAGYDMAALPVMRK